MVENIYIKLCVTDSFEMYPLLEVFNDINKSEPHWNTAAGSYINHKC